MSAQIGPLDTRVARLATSDASWHGYDFPVPDDGEMKCRDIAMLLGADYSVRVRYAATVTETTIPTDDDAHVVSGQVRVVGGSGMIITDMPELCERDEEGNFLCPNPELDEDVLREYIEECRATTRLGAGSEPGVVWCLGKCGDAYVPIQNADLCDLLDTFLDACTEYAKENPDAGLTLPKFETMGTLDNRRRFWAQITLGGFGVALSPDVTDDIVAYLLVTTSHNGKTCAQVSIVFVRVVCNNTLNMALDTEERVFSIKHTGNTSLKIENAKNGIKWLVQTMSDEKARLESYVATLLTDDDARLLCRAFFGFSTRQDWLSDRAIRLYMNTASDSELLGSETAPAGTLYRLLQALTQTIEETQAGKEADETDARIAAATARVSNEWRGNGYTPTAANALCASVVADYDGVMAAARKDAATEQAKRQAAELKRQEKAAAKESA